MIKDMISPAVRGHEIPAGIGDGVHEVGGGGDEVGLAGALGDAAAGLALEGLGVLDGDAVER